MEFSAKSLVFLSSLMMMPVVWASGPYTASIERIQSVDVGNPYNTVWLDLDITISPCSSTNEHNRYTITNKVQHATILAALMAGKQIRINGTGTCNSADIEDISSVQIW